MATPYISVDESEFPLVRMKFNIKSPTWEQYETFMHEQLRLLTYEKEMVFLMDCRKFGFLGSEMRIAQGKLFKENQVALQKYLLGAVLIVNSPLVKMMLKAIMLISSPPGKVVIVSSDEQGLVIAKIF